MAGRSVDPEKIIELLAELKEKTPEYPPDLMAARKAAFMQHAVSINLQSKGPGGQSGGGSGSGGGGAGPSGGTGFFGGLSATQGILLQAAVGVWIIAAMLTAAYAFRDQIVDLLQHNGIVEVTEAPLVEPAPTEFVAPVTEPSPTELPPTELPSPPASLSGDSGDLYEDLVEGGVPTETTDESVLTDENGKALGLTPGAPDVSGQGDPKATNKDKNTPPGQDKPDNPNKPEKTK